MPRRVYPIPQRISDVEEVMKRKNDLGLWLALVVGIQTAAITVAGMLLDAGEKTIVWLIFGTIVAFGLAGLRGQAVGLGRIIDILEEIRQGGSTRNPPVDK